MFLLEEVALIHGGHDGNPSNMTEQRYLDAYDRGLSGVGDYIPPSTDNIFGHGMTYSKDHQTLYSCGGCTNATTATNIAIESEIFSLLLEHNIPCRERLFNLQIPATKLISPRTILNTGPPI